MNLYMYYINFAAISIIHDFQMRPSKFGKTSKFITAYLLNKNADEFVQLCKTLNDDFLNSPKISNKFKNAIIKSFEICNDIGIAPLYPFVLYEQVSYLCNASTELL